jgi:hypothetical protein
MLRLVGFTKYPRAVGRASDVLDVPRVTRDALYGTTRKAEYQWRSALISQDTPLIVAVSFLQSTHRGLIRPLVLCR